MSNPVQLFGFYDDQSLICMEQLFLDYNLFFFPKNACKVISSLPQHLKLVWSRTFEWEVNDKIENDFSKLPYL